MLLDVRFMRNSRAKQRETWKITELQSVSTSDAYFSHTLYVYVCIMYCHEANSNFILNYKHAQVAAQLLCSQTFMQQALASRKDIEVANWSEVQCKYSKQSWSTTRHVCTYVGIYER